MSGLLKARIAFAIAIGLLLACALVVYGTLRSFAASERLVQHTQQVQVLLGESEAAIASAARARMTYVLTGNEDDYGQYQQAAVRVPLKLAELRRSTKDEPNQQSACDHLEQLVNERTQLWEKSVALKRSGTPQPAAQPDLTRQSVVFAEEIVGVTQRMRNAENGLLEQRRGAAGITLGVTTVILVLSGFTAVMLLFWHYRLLREELQAREQAEQNTREAARIASEAEQKARESENLAVVSNEAARRLSARLLHLQDDERRRLSRELHDSTGQHLAAAKMVLSSLAVGHDGDRRYVDSMELVDRSLREIRTISHLLHPSGLEEAGFSKAARWYTEEFSKRSGIQLTVEIADLPARLPREVELALFRVLQEALANMHRHSKSRTADVCFQADAEQLILTIRDHGIGMPKDVLDQFRSSGTAGVGLAGMRERVRELGGNLDLDSGSEGTSLQVTIPLRQGSAQAAGD
jgi:signal transduction histidine kinase